MKTITNLAQSRIRFHRSRTVFTVIAILLTTILLMGLGTSAMGLINGQKQMAASQNNYHAVMKNLTAEQLNTLASHMDVEAVQAQEIFAKIQYEKMNGLLTWSDSRKGSIYQGVGNLTAGRLPEAPEDICGPPAFFKRMHVEPSLGTRFSITFRPDEGAYTTREFVICGLVSEADLSKISVSDDRIAYGASVSEALVREYLTEEQRSFSALLRVNGEDRLNYDQIKDRIKGAAADIGCKESDLDFNNEYLFAMTDPGREIIGGVLLIALIILLFSGLVIYSIYYVCVITDVQEIGKLKALGASRRHIRGLLFREGLFAAALALPPGLLLGFLIPKLGLPLLMQAMSKYSLTDMPDMESIPMFSWPVLLLVICVIFLTVFLSLLKPIRMAARVSPVEAIRYQESSTDKRKVRKGYLSINLARLSLANLSRNRKRTLVTITTMGLSCVLFISLSALANSMSLEDFSRRTLPKGDFMISMRCNYNDQTYPETNLDRVQLDNPLSPALTEQILSIDGVKAVEAKQVMLAGSSVDSELFEKGRRVGITSFTRDDIPRLRDELKRGDLDYDQLVRENGILYCYDNIMADENFSMGQTLPLTFIRGEEQIPLDVKIAASGTWGGESFMLPKDIFDTLAGDLNTASDLYITVDPAQYDSIKPQLQKLAAGNQLFRMYSMDEERQVARLSINMVKYPLYAILILIGIISFMNLINTMVTSIITRKRELAVLQAIGLSDRQLLKMLNKEGMVFTLGTLAAALSVGNLLGYLVFLWGKNTGFMDVKLYHYPLWETLGLVLVLLLGQLLITFFIGKNVHGESLVDRIRSGE